MQLEERRENLEKYLQAISQDPVIVASKTFLKFLLKAQKVNNKFYVPYWNGNNYVNYINNMMYN